MKTFQPTFEQEQVSWLIKMLKEATAENKELRNGLRRGLDLLVEASRFEAGLFSHDHTLYDKIMGERPRLRKLLGEEFLGREK